MPNPSGKPIGGRRADWQSTLLARPVPPMHSIGRQPNSLIQNGLTCPWRKHGAQAALPAGAQ